MLLKKSSFLYSNKNEVWFADSYHDIMNCNFLWTECCFYSVVTQVQFLSQQKDPTTHPQSVHILLKDQHKCQGQQPRGSNIIEQQCTPPQEMRTSPYQRAQRFPPVCRFPPVTQRCLSLDLLRSLLQALQTHISALVVSGNCLHFYLFFMPRGFQET